MLPLLPTATPIKGEEFRKLAGLDQAQYDDELRTGRITRSISCGDHGHPDIPAHSLLDLLGYQLIKAIELDHLEAGRPTNESIVDEAVDAIQLASDEAGVEEFHEVLRFHTVEATDVCPVLFRAYQDPDTVISIYGNLALKLGATERILGLRAPFLFYFARFGLLPPSKPQASILLGPNLGGDSFLKAASPGSAPHLVVPAYLIEPEGQERSRHQELQAPAAAGPLIGVPTRPPPVGVP